MSKSRVVDEDYRRIYLAGRVKGTVGHDFWFADGPCEEPLVVFQHIHKTAGTAIRHLLHANYGDAGFEVISIPRRASRGWFAGLKDTLGDRFGSLRAAAGHSANWLLTLLGDRPAAAFTVVREPVDRVLSRYYFMTNPNWTLEELYGGRAKPQPAFFNGQARSLLAPLTDTSGIPLTADTPFADKWRERLEEALAAYTVVGTQDRFDETVEALDVLPGIRRRQVYRVRINEDRPPPSTLEPKLAELIRRHNWLDEHLYRLANERLDAARSGGRGPRR